MSVSKSRSPSLVVWVHHVQNMIERALTDPGLAPLLANYGYDSPVLEQGRALCEQVRALQHAQEREYGEQYAATAAVKVARERAEASFAAMQRLTRVALRGERGISEALGLKSAGKTGHASWIERARRFYTNALAHPELLEKLARFNVTHEQLETGRQQVDVLEQARRVQEREHGQALNATRARDEAVVALERWIQEFLVVAQAATIQRPDLRITLGLRGRA